MARFHLVSLIAMRPRTQLGGPVLPGDRGNGAVVVRRSYVYRWYTRPKWTACYIKAAKAVTVMVRPTTKTPEE